MRIEQLDYLREIRERAGEPVDLVNQHNIDCSRPDIGQELLHCGTIKRAAGERAIVIPTGDRPPALLRLTLYICLAGLALGVERGEGKVEVMLRGLAGVDVGARRIVKK